jgi:hypothetical protein
VLRCGGGMLQGRRRGRAGVFSLRQVERARDRGAERAAKAGVPAAQSSCRSSSTASSSSRRRIAAQLALSSVVPAQRGAQARLCAPAHCWLARAVPHLEQSARTERFAHKQGLPCNRAKRTGSTSMSRAEAGAGEGCACCCAAPCDPGLAGFRGFPSERTRFGSGFAGV